MNKNQIPDMIFEENKVKETYFDKYEGIQSEISQMRRFDENTDLSTTYLGTRGQTRNSVIKAEESFQISGQGYTVGKLADTTNCNILIDTGRSQSYMSKSFYMQSNVLHALPKFVPTTQRIQVGNGQYVALLFVILVIIEIHRHLFEVFTLVSEIHDNVDLVLGMNKCLCVGRYSRYARFLIQNFKQINTIFLKRADGSQTKRKEVCKDRSSIYR